MSTLAFLLVIVTAFFHASWNFATKKVSGDIAVMWNGFVMACILFSPVLFLLPSSAFGFPTSMIYILMSGSVHTIYFYALAKAYEHGEISVVYPIARGSGIAFTAIIALAFLGEQISYIGFLGISSFVIGGLLLGLRNRDQVHGILFALLVGIMIVSYSVIDKLAVGVMHPVAYMYSFMVVYTILLAPYVFYRKKTEMLNALANKKRYSLIIGVGVFVTYVVILFVFRISPVSYVVALREVAVAIGAVFGFVFLHERVSRSRVLGIVAIVVGMILIKLA